ncbi:substrate-binding domain-containing protein [Saccharothrix hoggarensis]|uniref:Substrate-binding domain-containing protein n=1 Tax=Saccharothrix hoggarensis TaxID=913853 RepID=A0ABW3QSL1_9PSEU
MAQSPRPGAPVTVAQVGMHAGVSRQTVAAVLATPNQVEPHVRDRVLASIEALGYRPDRGGRTPNARSAGLVGYGMSARVAPTSIMSQFPRALARAVEDVGRHMLLFTTPEDPENVDAFDELLAQRAVDAFVLTDTVRDDPRHLWLTERNVPFVVFGRTWPTNGAQPGLWVDVDGAGACARLVAGLHRIGHRRVGLVGLTVPTVAVLDRVAGWRAGCERHDLPSGDDLVVAADADCPEAGEAAARALLDSADPPTAIMAVSDTLAVGVLREVRRRGGCPGEDIAVTGFDDSPAASVVEGGLTTVRQPLDQVAAALVELLGTGDRRRGVLLPGEVVSRGSAPIG